MAGPILKTKLYISPLQSENVPRLRLIQRLNMASLRDFTLISAPAGFGKTTLLREWIRDQRLDIAWFSIDRGDNDPIRFWSYIVAALQTIEPNLGITIFAALQTPHPPLIETLIPELINEISLKNDCSPGLKGNQKMSLVLDDYHLITDTRVHESLFFFIENLPACLHVIISSRSDPPWPLARLRARRKLAELRVEEIRFRSDEVASFLNQVMKLDISQNDITALEKRTEGWIVGLQMAALSMRNRSDIPAFIRAFTGTNRFILDYLLEEVLEQQPVDIQMFLLKTSILNQVTAPLCDFILERSDSHQILVQLEKTNLFLTSLDDRRQWFRYHHLFSELLRNQLNLTYPDGIPGLNLKASQWFETQGFIDETVTHAFSGQDNERVAYLCEKYAQNMLQQNKHSLLSTWLEALPVEMVYQRPWLCVYQSWTRHWAGMREQGEACLENAEKMIDHSVSIREDERKRLTGSIATVRAHYALINEQLPQAVEYAIKALRLLPETDFYTPGTAGVALGGAYWGQGEIAKAEDAFLGCAATAMKGDFVYRASSALCYAGMQQVKQGKLRLAEKTYNQALFLAQGPGGHQSPVAGYPLAKMSELLLEWNQLIQARKLASDGVKFCTQLGHVDLIAEAYIALANIQLVDEDFSGVQASLHQVEQLTLQTKLDPWVLGWLAECKVRLWLANGDLEQATFWAESSGLSLDKKFSFHYDLHHITLARVWTAQIVKNYKASDSAKCLSLLDRLLITTDEYGWVNHKIQVLIFQALVLQAIQNQKDALKTLRTAITLSEPEGYVGIFIREGPEMKNLLEKLTYQGATNIYITNLLKAFPLDTASQVAELVESLSPREMEVLNLLTTSLSVKDIAGELIISVNTARSHIKSIYSKLGVNRRLDAIEKARDLKLTP